MSVVTRVLATRATGDRDRQNEKQQGAQQVAKSKLAHTVRLLSAILLESPTTRGTPVGSGPKALLQQCVHKSRPPGRDVVLPENVDH